MKPPPPRLPASGLTTASAKPVAMAASTAFPPSWRTASPTSEAYSSVETTMPSAPVTGVVSLENAHVVGMDSSAAPVVTMGASSTAVPQAVTHSRAQTAVMGNSTGVGCLGRFERREGGMERRTRKRFIWFRLIGSSSSRGGR